MKNLDEIEQESLREDDLFQFWVPMAMKFSDLCSVTVHWRAEFQFGISKPYVLDSAMILGFSSI